MCTYLLLFFISCTQKTSHLDLFFGKLVNHINNELILNDIKSYSQDSLHLMLGVFGSEYNELVEKLKYEQEWQSPLDSSLIIPYWSSRNQILLFAFQKYLNQETIDLDEIQNKIEQEHIRYEREMVKKKKLHKKEPAR